MQDGELTRAQAPVAPGPPASPPLPIDRPAVGPAPIFRPGMTPPIRPEPLGLARQTFGAPTFGGARPSGPSLTSLERFPMVGIPQMLGDQSPIFGPAQVTPAPSGGNTVRLPWVRGYKMADNQSPWPVDRVFVASYYYDDLNFGASQLVRDIRVWRQFFGFEKTFLDGSTSLGLRLPLNTISAESLAPGVGGTSTSLGDLTVFLKHALWSDPERGDVFSLGFAVTPPTGPAAFAGAEFARPGTRRTSSPSSATSRPSARACTSRASRGSTCRPIPAS